MPTVAHLADLHLGFNLLNARAEDGRNQRLVDFEHAALTCADRIVEEGPAVAVIAGDLLHQTQLYPASLSGAATFCRRITEAGIPLIAIGGNHDEAELPGGYNSLRYLAQHHGLGLHLDQSHVDVDGVRLHLVSFRVLSRAGAGRGEIEPFEWSNELANVLVTHGYAPGDGIPELPAEREVRVPEEWLSDPRFAACLLGHIHHHGRLRPELNAFYAGSTERRNFGEVAERPGFWFHDFENDALTRSRSVYVDELAPALPRPMFTHQIDCATLTVEDLDRTVRGLLDRDQSEGAMVRVVLDNVSAELDRHEAKGRWDKLFRDRGGFFFEATTRTRQMSELLEVEFTTPPLDVGQGLIEYVDKAGADLDEDLRKEIATLAASVVGEAREAVLAQESD